MLNKLRTTILIVFAAYIGFVVAGMALVGLLDDSPMVPFMKTNPGLSVAMAIIQAGAVVALLAVVVGGVPLTITVIRRALTIDRKSLGFLLVPVYSLLAIGLYLGFILMVSTGRIQIAGVVRAVQPGNFPLGNQLLLAGLMLVFILGAIASTWAVWKVISRTNTEQETVQVGGRTVIIEIYKFAYLPAVITAFSMLVMLCATVVWSWLVFSALPQVFAGNFGLWMTSTQVSLYSIIVVMVVCSLAALFGVVRGRSAMIQA